MFLCCRGNIVKIFLVDGDTLGGEATGLGVDILGSLKMGGCCDVSAEEAFDKIKSSLNRALLVVVSYGGSGGFLLFCFNTAVKYLVVAIIMLVAVSVVIIILWVKQDTVCTM